MSDVDVEMFLGKTAESIEQNCDEEVIFAFTDGSRFKMYHREDCCERVWLEDVTGAWDDLIGEPMLMAEVETADGSDDEDCSESRTWTFYRFATVKGYVTLRWCGESNGYYSESVDIVQLDAARAIA